MSLGELTSPEAVLAAVNEFQQVGRLAFLDKYGFGFARAYFLRHEGQLFDSKAIVGAAHGFQRPDLGPLKAADFSGGDSAAAAKLRELGFEVVVQAKLARQERADLPKLSSGRTYSWEEVATEFGFKPAYFSVAGGMVSAPSVDALLLITHPGGARSFDYGDTWDGSDLIYTGKGKVGDQKWDSANRDTGENLRALFVFEAGGARRLRFLGQAACIEHFQTLAPDSNGDQRRVFKFRLRFLGEVAPNASAELPGARPKLAATPIVSLRQLRPFHPSVRPSSPSLPVAKARPDETLALKEKAVQGHHDVLVALGAALQTAKWSDIGEAPGGMDLCAKIPGANGTRVIFEAKTLSGENEVHQTRAAVAQLLEYRFFDGAESDQLCLVTNAPISDPRARFLGSLQVTVLWWDGGAFQLGGGANRSWAAGLVGQVGEPA